MTWIKKEETKVRKLLICLACILFASELSAQQQDGGREDTGAGVTLNLEDRLPGRIGPTDELVDIKCTIRNQTSVAVTSGQIGVKDEDTNSSTNCNFGGIPSGQSRTVTVMLPGRIERALYSVNFADGNTVIGGGTCVNCTEVVVTITDN